MPAVTLPNGTIKSFDGPVTIADVAASIGPGLAKAAVAGVVNGESLDLAMPIETDADVRLLTAKDAEGVDICLLYTSPSPRDVVPSRMPSSA